MANLGRLFGALVLALSAPLVFGKLLDVVPLFQLMIVEKHEIVCQGDKLCLGFFGGQT